MKKAWKNWIKEDILKVSEVKRWNCEISIKKESVAEHSWIVSYICLVYGFKLHLKPITVYTSMILGTVHDIPEIISNDIPSYFKNDNDAVHKAICDFELKFLKQNLPSNLHWVLEKKNVVSLLLFKFADYLSRWLFCKREMTLGNKSKSIIHALKESEKLCEQEWKKLIKYKNENQ